MPSHRALLAAAIAISTVRGLHAQVLINEVCASNWDLLMAAGEYEDWIELFNAGGAAADLSGSFLSDKASDPGKWPIPAGTIIPAGGHLLVFASKKNGIIGGELHTNFKLTQTDAEDVVLSDPGLLLLDQFHFDAPAQKNHSWGRTTDGAANWGIFIAPTPNTSNSGAGPYYGARPVLDPVAGGYAGSVSVSMSAAPGTTIRYTLDGTAPTAGSTTYATPIALSATTCVRAVAFSSDPAVPPSFVETNTYFIDEVHTVPVWSIAAGQDVLDILNIGSNPIIAEGNVEYFDASLTLLDETFGEFNEHGGTSNSNDQRALDYIVRDEFGYDHRIEGQLFRGKDRDRFERIILKAAAGDNYPGYDGAHIRDAFVQSLGQKIGLKLDSRTYEPCVAYVNGQYWGVYETREKVDDNDYTEHYYDQPGERVDMIQEYGGVWADYGTTAGWWDLFTFITGNDMADPANYAQVQDTLSTLSMIDHMIINEYMVNGSWLAFNTMWWRGKDPDGDHKKFGYCCWDMDWICGTTHNEFGFPESTPVNDPCDHDVVVIGSPSETDFAGTHFAMFNALMANDQFREQYIDRYADLINTGLSCASTVQHLDSLIALIDPEMARHCTRWGGTYADWLAKVQYLRDFLLQRCAFIEQGLIDCYQVAPHDIVVDVMPPGSGMVHLNTLDLVDFPWNGTYFDSLLLDFRAEAYAGWDFDHWSTDSNTVSPSALDSAMRIQLLHADTIIAWFKPDVRYAVLLDVEPDQAGDIRFGGTLITDFPQVSQVSEDVPYGVKAFPHMYYDFVRWEVRQHAFTPGDPLLDSINIRFLGPDTIVAHFKPHEFGYFVPNAFTPNGDGFNDAWLPLGDRIDLERYDLRVFDRWGEEIFASADFHAPWDGTRNGTALPPAVYVYHIELRDAITRQKQELFGYVTLVR